MREKIIKVEGVDISEFKENLKNNKGTCICSIDYDNPDMKCMCKDFRELKEVGVPCHCGIFVKVSVDI